MFQFRGLGALSRGLSPQSPAWRRDCTYISKCFRLRVWGFQIIKTEELKLLLKTNFNQQFAARLDSDSASYCFVRGS